MGKKGENKQSLFLKEKEKSYKNPMKSMRSTTST